MDNEFDFEPIKCSYKNVNIFLIEKEKFILINNMPNIM